MRIALRDLRPTRIRSRAASSTTARWWRRSPRAGHEVDVVSLPLARILRAPSRAARSGGRCGGAVDRDGSVPYDVVDSGRARFTLRCSRHVRPAGWPHAADRSRGAGAQPAQLASPASGWRSIKARGRAALLRTASTARSRCARGRATTSTRCSGGRCPAVVSSRARPRQRRTSAMTKRRRTPSNPARCACFTRRRCNRSKGLDRLLAATRERAPARLRPIHAGRRRRQRDRQLRAPDSPADCGAGSRRARAVSRIVARGLTARALSAQPRSSRFRRIVRLTRSRASRRSVTACRCSRLRRVGWER